VTATKTDSNGPRNAIFVEILHDESGALPCETPDDCAVCVLLSPPREGEGRIEHGKRLMAAMLRAEWATTQRRYG